jgi:hypothetical protein
MIKDIQLDMKQAAKDSTNGEYLSLSFVNFKIKQTEINTEDELMRIQSKPVRRNVTRFIK